MFMQMIGKLAIAAFATMLLTVPAQASSLAEFFSAQTAGSKQTVDHATWDRLLGKFVIPAEDGLNRVDYARFKSEGHAELKQYVERLEAVDVLGLDRTEQFAFWANLYNAKTIDVVLDHYPVDSIRKISINDGLFGFLKKSVGFGGPWKAKIMKVAGKDLSLDDIEHGIMRPVFKDPRVHYAVNCASIGCPNLRIRAFTGANLEAELNAGAREYVNSSRGISVSDGSVTASSIYSWFQSDFGGSAAGVLEHVRTYASPELNAKLEGMTSITGYAYDWSLNDVKTN
jgi:hypothetical protein